MSWYLAFCGGHQSSTGALLASDFSLLECVIGPPLNLHTLHPDKLGQRFDKILCELGDRVGISSRLLLNSTIHTVAALPGIATEYDRQYTHLSLSPLIKSPSDITVVDDTACGLFGGALKDRGICVIANTGASILAKYGCDSSHKFDGWGAVIGDHGSGFDVAQMLFHELGRNRDKNIDSELFEDLSKHLRMKEHHYVAGPQDVQLWFDNICRDSPTDWRAIFGDTATVVTNAAKRTPPNAVAVSILQEAALRLTRTLEICLSRHQDLVAEGVCCQGGMFEFSPTFRDTVFSTIRNKHNLEIKLGTYRPIVGALMMALSGGKGFPGPPQLRSLLGVVDRAQDSSAILRPALRGLV